MYCYPVSRDSAYVPLLFTGIEDRYGPVYREDGTLDDAIRVLAAGSRAVVHVHWEEFLFRASSCAEEAEEALARFCQRLTAFCKAGGTLVWTVHNEVPHVSPFGGPFLAARRELARRAHAILVHDEASIDVLRAQAAFDRALVHVVPHPSYLGRHEDEATLLAALGEPFERRVQAFGWIRRQKGYGEMIRMLPAEFLRSHDAHIRITGTGEEAALVMAESVDRPDVRWDVRHVPDAEVPRLLRTAACVVLPYERVLTSGVAMLAMSTGAMLVAVDVPQIRNILSKEARAFLFPRGDARAFRETIDAVFALAAPERLAILRANLEAARAVRPAAIAARLASIYDRVIAP